MDDYSALRDFTRELLDKEAHLFPVRDAFQYQPYSYIAASANISWLGPKGFQGADFYMGENPEFGAAFTYYLKEGFKSLEDIRKEEEKKRREKGETVYYPSYEQLKAEAEEEPSFLIFTVKDVNGETVSEIRTPGRKGINRIYWDLTYPNLTRVRTNIADPTRNLESGIMVLPGTYTVELAKSEGGVITPLSGPVEFEVKSLNNLTLPPKDPQAMLAFHKELMRLSKSANSARSAYGEISDRMEYYKAAARLVESSTLNQRIERLEIKLDEIRQIMYGDPIKNRLEIDQPPTLNNRINTAINSGLSSTMDPTETSKMVKQIAETQLRPVIASLKEILNTDLPAIDAELSRLGAPWTPGRIIDLDD